MDSLGSASINGKVGEWLKPSVLKTDDPKGSGSSNLSLTAKPHLSDCRWNTEDAQWRPPALGQQETQ